MKIISGNWRKHEFVKVFVLMALVAIAMMASTVIAFAIGSGRG